MNKKMLIFNVLVLTIVLTLAVPTVNALTTVKGDHWAGQFRAILSDNLWVTLSGWAIGGVGNSVAYHDETAAAVYEIRLVTAQKDVDQKNWQGQQQPYVDMRYQSATIEVQGEVTAEVLATTPIDSPAGPGRAFLKVTATTQVDERRPPMERRPYKIFLHIKGVEGVRADSSVVNLGDYTVIFEDDGKRIDGFNFIFWHNERRQILHMGGIQGGASLRNPLDQTTYAEGPLMKLFEEEIIIDLPIFIDPDKAEEVK